MRLASAKWKEVNEKPDKTNEKARQDYWGDTENESRPEGKTW